jgi:hypothetical protein
MARADVMKRATQVVTVQVISGYDRVSSNPSQQRWSRVTWSMGVVRYWSN